MSAYTSKYSSKRSNFKPRSLKHEESKFRRNLIWYTIVSGILLIGFIFWGLPAIVGGLSIFNKFKPVTKNTQEIENVTIAPPVLNIPYEATNSATITINGYSTSGFRVEISVNDLPVNTVSTSADGSFQALNIPLQVGTNFISGKTVNDLNEKSLSSKAIRILYDNEKPKLEISEPTDGQEVKGGDKKFRVVGKTDPDNRVMANGTTAIVGADGSFSVTVGLNEGETMVTVTATNLVGNTTEVSRKVIYTP